jgi:hypothetical protein
MTRPILGALQVRSGRFENPSTTPIQIIAASDDLDRLYRFHNTGKNPLVIEIGTASFTIKSKGAVDLLVDEDLEVKAGKGRGVYDLLLGSSVARSGSFNVNNAVIANLRSASYLYRIINSNEEKSLKVDVKLEDATTLSFTVAAKSSLDLPLTGSVTVIGNDGSMAEGVFDVLGIGK